MSAALDYEPSVSRECLTRHHDACTLAGCDCHHHAWTLADYNLGVHRARMEYGADPFAASRLWMQYRTCAFEMTKPERRAWLREIAAQTSWRPGDTEGDR